MLPATMRSCKRRDSESLDLGSTISKTMGLLPRTATQPKNTRAAVSA